MELYISTLEALIYCGPLKITGISYKAKMNCSQIKEFIADLMQKKLVEKRLLGKQRVVYVATPRANTVISHFEKLKEMLPTEEEYQDQSF
jgi:predicted transcriptional regulator